jgi:hypothetical protein
MGSTTAKLQQQQQSLGTKPMEKENDKVLLHQLQKNTELFSTVPSEEFWIFCIT